jgi:hypothetical protein
MYTVIIPVIILIVLVFTSTLFSGGCEGSNTHYLDTDPGAPDRNEEGERRA